MKSKLQLKKVILLKYNMFHIYAGFAKYLQY